jgi:hypothetical protein
MFSASRRRIVDSRDQVKIRRDALTRSDAAGKQDWTMEELVAVANGALRTEHAPARPTWSIPGGRCEGGVGITTKGGGSTAALSL